MSENMTPWTPWDWLAVCACLAITAWAATTDPVQSAVDAWGEAVWRQVNDCPQDYVFAGGGMYFGCNMYNPYREARDDSD